MPIAYGAGADVEACDEKGWSALHHEAERGKPECVQLLLDAGADVNGPDWRGQTPLHASIRIYAGTARVLRSTEPLRFSFRLFTPR
ncbi:hypothetical protein HDU96_002195 [Phlyctochytrium bullatum]|nr:hypothetical protein HDU96_002195 [Phlyctochytrium bullatum]